MNKYKKIFHLIGGTILHFIIILGFIILEFNFGRPFFFMGLNVGTAYLLFITFVSTYGMYKIYQYLLNKVKPLVWFCTFSFTFLFNFFFPYWTQSLTGDAWGELFLYLLFMFALSYPVFQYYTIYKKDFIAHNLLRNILAYNICIMLSFYAFHIFK